MIDIIDSVVDQVSTIPGLHVYRMWPELTPQLPVAIISHISGVPTFTDHLGTEILARLAYSVDIYAEGIAQAEGIAEQVADRLARISMHRSGYADGFDGSDYTYRISMTFSGVVDRRGNVFTQG